MDLVLLFKKHVQDLFPVNAEYVSDDFRKIRIRFPLSSDETKNRKSQPIVLIFDDFVIQAYSLAEKNSDIETLERYKSSLRRLVIAGLNGYVANGPIDTAHRIEIDDRATDL